jgi:glycerophosphoryl diester phosphodiesterase
MALDGCRAPTQTAMNEPHARPPLARRVWDDFLRARHALFIFEFVFTLAQAWLLVPATAWVLAVVLARAGHIAVSNHDILAFFLTPAGVIYVALCSTFSVALLLFKQANVMVVASLTGPEDGRPVKAILRTAALRSLRVVRLGVPMAALLVLALSPFVLLAGLTYAFLLTKYDIYFYLNVRPPAFWVAAGIGVLLLLGALAVVVRLAVGWAFSLPILVFENQSARAALQASRQRVRGAGWRVGSLLLGWLVGVLLLGAALETGYQLLAAAVLANAGDRPVALILLLLLGQIGLLATLSFVLVVGLALLTRGLYLRRCEQLGLLAPDGAETALGTEQPLSPWRRRLAYLSWALFVLAPVTLWTDLSRYTQARPMVRVTAHRGHARAAPENTLSAMRKAIESGADYAELDVQRTADGVIVLLHDRDLKRVAGVSRRLDELSYTEVRKLDVGSWFDPAFAGEPVPTLEQVINLARGRIKLNIELKFFGPDRGLALAVARLVREQDFESECLVTSLNYDALVEVKRHNPRLRTGLIVAKALGDVSRLGVEALSVRAGALTDEMLRAAHRLGMEVHVWTVNDGRQMVRLMKRGVDNILTSVPDQAIRVRDEWASLTGTERLLLTSRLLLGLDP